jgi:hypothetical protein
MPPRGQRRAPAIDGISWANSARENVPNIYEHIPIEQNGASSSTWYYPNRKVHTISERTFAA